MQIQRGVVGVVGRRRQSTKWGLDTRIQPPRRDWFPSSEAEQPPASRHASSTPRQTSVGCSCRLSQCRCLSTAKIMRFRAFFLPSSNTSSKTQKEKKTYFHLTLHETNPSPRTRWIRLKAGKTSPSCHKGVDAYRTRFFNSQNSQPTLNPESTVLVLSSKRLPIVGRCSRCFTFLAIPTNPPHTSKSPRSQR